MQQRQTTDGGRERPKIPKGMRKVQQRFERWRGSHTGRLPIPESLWASAAHLAREHGVFRTAQVLHLEYGKLKRLADVGGPVRRSRAQPPAFVELLGSQAAGFSECLIELEGPRGKMRIQWKGTTTPDLVGLSRALWEPA
jgi:hypothetical protein